MDKTFGINLVDQQFPEGTVAGPLVVSVTDTVTNLVVGSQTVTGESVTFAALPAGAYAVSCIRTDDKGNALGVASTPFPFVIDAPAPVFVTISIPVSMFEAPVIAVPVSMTETTPAV